MDQSFAAGLVGIVLDGRYRLDALLGEGGMGAVFRATHLGMERKVAVKLLKPHLTTDQAALQRFAREARSTLKVDSPHAVKLLDFGVTPHSDYYMVLEYLDGRTVQRELDIDGPFAPARAIHIAKQALRALAAAHTSGLIHRDIKPDNILLMRVDADPDFAKVLDFGVAKLMEGAARSTQSALAITQAGMVFGTPEFISPEQACGQTLDPRSDLYSLAATLFAMLTGCGMYPAKSAIEWLTSHARTPPPHLVDGLAELAAYQELDAVLQRCLAKRRDDRPASADEMHRLLERVEPTITRGAGAASTPTPGRGIGKAPSSPSSYIAAIDPAATLLPPTATPPATPAAIRDHAATAPTLFAGTAPTPVPGTLPAVATAPTVFSSAGPTTTGVIAAVKGSRRGVYLALGALAIVAMLAGVIVVATRKKARSTPPAVASKVVADAALPPADAQVAAAPADAPVPVDAAIPAITSGSTSRPPPAAHPNLEVARHVAAAEEAQRAGKRMQQLQEADAALRLDPKNLRARFLLGDALIAYGDLDRGCKYLRDLGRNPQAQARSRQAGCPTD